jgi:hypothetical protein
MDNGGIKAPTSSRLFRQIAATVVGRNSTLGDLVANMMADDDSDDGKDDVVMDHRVLPRDEKSQYLHEEMQARLQKDYLSPTPLFDVREFNTMFRISRSRFQRIMEDIAATGNQFYLNTVDATGKPGACFEACFASGYFYQHFSSLQDQASIHHHHCQTSSCYKQQQREQQGPQEQQQQHQCVDDVAAVILMRK